MYCLMVGYCDDEEFQFVEALRGIWVLKKIYPDEGYKMLITLVLIQIEEKAQNLKINYH